MVVTLSGPNTYARKLELAARVQAFKREHGAMAVEQLDGDETTAERLQEALASLPFLTARKLVVLREPGKQQAFSERISAVLSNIADTTDVIMYEPKLDKRSAYYKTLKKETDFKEFGELDAAGLMQWAGSYAQEQGGHLDSTSAQLLVDRVGPNQQLLQQELDKLLAYDATITPDTIKLLTEPAPASTVFELMDAAFAGNSRQALTLYREQRALRLEPQAIIAMLAWQLHVLAVIKSAGARSPDQIATEAKINPFVVRKSVRLARRLTFERIKQLVADLLQLDMQLKRSSIDADEAVQLYLLSLA